MPYDRNKAKYVVAPIYDKNVKLSDNAIVELYFDSDDELEDFVSDEGDAYSDEFKDVYGIRPRWQNYADLANKHYKFFKRVDGHSEPINFKYRTEARTTPRTNINYYKEPGRLMFHKDTGDRWAKNTTPIPNVTLNGKPANASMGYDLGIEDDNEYERIKEDLGYGDYDL